MPHLGGVRDDGWVNESVAPQRGRWAIAGIVAGIAGLAAAYLSARALSLPVDPVVAVSESVRDLTPGPLAVWLVKLVGTLDKPLLLAGTVVIALGISALAGVLARRRLWLGQLLFVGLGALAIAALLTRPNVGSRGAIVGLLTIAGALIALGALTPREQVIDRRWFLKRTGLVVGASAAAVAVGAFVGQARRRVEEARQLIRLPVGPGRQPAGAELGVRGIASWRTPNDDFYLIDTAVGGPPSIRPEEWSLRIHGLVDREITLTYDDLVSRELASGWVTLCCVSNEVGGDLIGNAFWSGVPIRELLAEAGVQDGADAVLQTSDDGWTCGTPLEALTDDRNAMLAVAMNGQPLPIEHGFPVRSVVPGLYGYVSATKWVVDLEVTRFEDISAYWIERGWGEKGPVKTQSRIDVPRPGDRVASGRLAVGGVAWAQHTGIEKVEYQLDGGRWTDARIGTGGMDDDTWVQWSADVEVGEGDHILLVRATDKTGSTQTSARSDVLPDGATGWHQVDFSAG